MVLSILDEAAEWLQSVGITDQWPASFSASSEWVEEFRDLIRRKSVFIAICEEDAVGCAVLEEHPYGYSIELLWPDGSVEAVMLSRLAVRRSVAAQGAATQLFDWAVDYARSRGKQELRLDCWAGNERLKRYYTEAGFESRGDVESPGFDLSSSGRSYLVSRFSRPAS
jgi:GNAT superfamily N-acetyltransferase